MEYDHGCYIDTENLPVMNILTPFNVQLCAIYGRSFAYYSVKCRQSDQITKIIDQLTLKGDADSKLIIAKLEKLKSDMQGNKEYELLSVDTAEARQWNEFIKSQRFKRYFTNNWLFTECYGYRKLYEIFQLSNNLKEFDYFGEQKNQSLADNFLPICFASNKLVEMLDQVDKETIKQGFRTLLKLCLWGNKCDLTFSLGNGPAPGGATGGDAPKTNMPSRDPFQMVVDLDNMLLADDTEKFADYVIATARNMLQKVTTETDEEGKPKQVTFDIVCDNSGYELFADLCLAVFLIEHKIVQKVRFHLKKMPWFISDVTPTDFKYVIETCRKVSFSKEISAGADGDPITVNSESLNRLGEKWCSMFESGAFVIMADDYWTNPLSYYLMKKIDPDLYRKLQSPIAVMFKGDLNYRKLLGDRKLPPATGFEDSLQGFHPAPLLAVRTVKSEPICGIQKQKFDELGEQDSNWMNTGNYGIYKSPLNAVTTTKYNTNFTSISIQIKKIVLKNYGDTFKKV